MVFSAINLQYLREICNILGDTAGGLTGSEIGEILSDLDIPDPYSASTKRYRLYEALALQQSLEQSAVSVIRFIETAMAPIRYTRNPSLFEERRQRLNMTLSFCGLKLGDNGKISSETPANTLEEAQQRATNLRAKLKARGVHKDVLDFCHAELLVNNYFHAVLEATKSIAEKVRTLSGQGEDGGKLVQIVFGGETPIQIINSFQTESHWSEQSGFANLLIGVFGVFRNPTAHAPKIYWVTEEDSWVIDEEDALDLMSLASYIHRRLDHSKRNEEGKTRSK